MQISLETINNTQAFLACVADTVNLFPKFKQACSVTKFDEFNAHEDTELLNYVALNKYARYIKTMRDYHLSKQLDLDDHLIKHSLLIDHSVELQPLFYNLIDDTVAKNTDRSQGGIYVSFNDETLIEETMINPLLECEGLCSVTIGIRCDKPFASLKKFNSKLNLYDQDEIVTIIGYNTWNQYCMYSQEEYNTHTSKPYTCYPHENIAMGLNELSDEIFRPLYLSVLQGLDIGDLKCGRITCVDFHIGKPLGKEYSESNVYDFILRTSAFIGRKNISL